MRRTFKALAAAAVVAAAASMANAAPSTMLGETAPAVESSVIRVHGNHHSCQRDRYGWHRHTDWGERRSCRTWRGRGPRPDFCVRVGGLWLCDY
jgi:hypothetical protein